MPLPAAHALAGAAVYAALDEDGSLRPNRRLVLAMVVANAPDLDLVPGMWLGDPNRFHHGLTHTLLAAVVVGLLAAAGARSRDGGWPVRLGPSSAVAGAFVMVASAWASHIVLDVFTHDPSPPVGVPALWPLLDERFSLGPVFLRAEKVAGPASGTEFLLSLMTPHNLVALARETLILLPLVAAARWWRWARGDRASER